MDQKEHQTKRSHKYAMMSACLQYRFVLSRAWEPNSKIIGFVLLNPSTADERIDDPTVKKLIAISKFNGFGGFLLANIFGLRSSKPQALYHHSDPIGPLNDYWIAQVCRWSNIVVCGWGNHGKFLRRGINVKSIVPSSKRFAFGFNISGQPTHPLFLSPTTKLLRWK